MKKFSLCVIGFLLLILVGSSGYASTLPLMNFDGTTKTIIIGDNTYTIENRDTGTYGNLSTDPYGDPTDPYGYLTKSTISDADLLNWSGFYIGTITSINSLPANDSVYTIAELLSYFCNDTFSIASTDWDKVETPDEIGGVGDSASGIENNFLTLTYDKFKLDEDDPTQPNLEEPIAGTWSTSSNFPSDPDPITDPWLNIYTVKASNEFALYYVDPTLQTGFWSSIHITNDGGNIAAISHYTGILGQAPDDDNEFPTPGTGTVPEPGTMILLGFGLIGLAGIGRRKIKK